MSVEQVKPPTTRKPGLYPAGRRCEGCGAKLSRNNPGEICAPCNNGQWKEGEGEALTEAQLKELRVARLEEIDAVAA